MKVLFIDYDYFNYPEGITCIKDFVDYANKNYNSFIELTKFNTENCTFPYLVENETTQVYLNIARLNEIREEEATILTRLEYDARLKKVVEEKCVDCVHYKEELNGDNLVGHRSRISLDGKCFGFEKKED